MKNKLLIKKDYREIVLLPMLLEILECVKTVTHDEELS